MNDEPRDALGRFAAFRGRAAGDHEAVERGLTALSDLRDKPFGTSASRDAGAKVAIAGRRADRNAQVLAELG